MSTLGWAALLIGIPVVGFVAYKVVAAPAAAPPLPAPVPKPALPPPGPGVALPAGATPCQQMVANLIAQGNLAAARNIAAICPGAATVPAG